MVCVQITTLVCRLSLQQTCACLVRSAGDRHCICVGCNNVCQVQKRCKQTPDHFPHELSVPDSIRHITSLQLPCQDSLQRSRRANEDTLHLVTSVRLSISSLHPAICLVRDVTCSWWNCTRQQPSFFTPRCHVVTDGIQHRPATPKGNNQCLHAHDAADLCRPCWHTAKWSILLADVPVRLRLPAATHAFRASWCHRGGHGLLLLPHLHARLRLTTHGVCVSPNGHACGSVVRWRQPFLHAHCRCPVCCSCHGGKCHTLTLYRRGGGR